MKSRFSKRAAAWLAVAGSLAAMPAVGIEYKSIDAPVAVLYDAPSLKGGKRFLLKRYTPVEVVVSVEGFTKVREPEGAIGWVEKQVLANKRQLMVTVAKAQVRAAADEASALVFEAEKNVALELVEPAKDGWVKVRHLDGQVGMVRISQVWGL